MEKTIIIFNVLFRAVSVTSMLKSIFMKDNPHTGTDIKPVTQPQSMNSGLGRSDASKSSVSLNRNSVHGGTLKITDQVIEEVDEQLTLTSMPRTLDKPHIKSIFPETVGAEPSPSDIVGVPLGVLPF